MNETIYIENFIEKENVIGAIKNVLNIAASEQIDIYGGGPLSDDYMVSCYVDREHGYKVSFDFWSKHFRFEEDFQGFTQNLANKIASNVFICFHEDKGALGNYDIGKGILFMPDNQWRISQYEIKAYDDGEDYFFVEM